MMNEIGREKEERREMVDNGQFDEEICDGLEMDGN